MESSFFWRYFSHAVKRNICGQKAFSDRDFQMIMLALGNFKEELALFSSRLTKSEKTQSYIVDLQALLSKVDIQSDQTLNYSNTGSLTVDIGREDAVSDYSSNVADVEDEDEDNHEEDLADGAVEENDGW